MAKKRDLTGNSKIDVGNGFFISTKMTLGGMQYLEDQYDMPADQIQPGGKTKDIIVFLTALGMSANPDITLDEVKKKISAIKADQLDAIVSQLPDMQAKNPTKGNLIEKESR